MRNHPPRPVVRKPRERGTILMVAMFVSVFMIIVSVPFLARFRVAYRTTEKSFDSLAAVNLAEAGIERTIWELNFGKNIASWAGTSMQRTLALNGMTASDGTVIGDVGVIVDDPSGDNPVVTATGTVTVSGATRISRTIRVVLERGDESKYKFAVFSETGMDLRGNARVDSYDPAFGAYDKNNPRDNGDVGTNATLPWEVVLVNNAHVFGDAVTGAHSDPDDVIELRNRADITGSRTTLSAYRDVKNAVPAFPNPAEMTALGNVSVSSNQTISTDSYISSLTIQSQKTLTISGGTEADPVRLYFNGPVTFENQANMTVAANSWVEIYCRTGPWAMGSGSNILNTYQDPNRLIIHGDHTFTQMSLKSNIDTYMLLDIPFAALSFEANAGLFGAVIVDYLAMDAMGSDGGIHYDERMGLSSKYRIPGDTYIVKSWQEIL